MRLFLSKNYRIIGQVGLNSKNVPRKTKITYLAADLALLNCIKIG